MTSSKNRRDTISANTPGARSSASRSGAESSSRNARLTSSPTTPCASCCTSPAVTEIRSRMRASSARVALWRRSSPASACGRAPTTRLLGTLGGISTSTPSPRSSWWVADQSRPHSANEVSSAS
ncbi:hypothetical protein [Saccharothrix xinjiangensis]|uniref:hypothetical protein n=1 Tax=Saccharothrix xinjiangensis TaxID=204798 RepID=UPI0031D84F7F